jgi:hypothetical protein
LLALVLLEAAAIALLGLLVAGLLRSHADILRRLHHLDGGMDPGDRRPVAPPARRDGAPLRPLAGETPDGAVVSVALDRPGERTLLLFLSSGCGTCAAWWQGLRDGRHAVALPGVRVVVVAQDASEESPSLLTGLAPPDVTVVLAGEAWERFSVPGSPYAVLVDGSAARPIGEGVARSWAQLASLVGQHLGDLAAPPAALDGAARERRADDELLAAGIHPGHPSLHPAAGAWSRPSRP